MSKEAASGLPGDRPQGSAPPPPSRWWQWLVLAALVLGLGLVLAFPVRPASTPALSYSRFVRLVDAGKVKEVSIASNGEATGVLRDGQGFETTIPLSLAGPPLLATLEAHRVSVVAEAPGVSLGAAVLEGFLSFLPFLLLLGWVLYLGRRSGAGALSGITGVGRARAKVFAAERPQTRFSDVAGYEGAKREVQEVVEFLQRPERFWRVGAVAPRGVLLVGPPGTGKTLLARAVAGEAGVPFLSTSGSSFVEMFVGVGASRVRDLFEQARKLAPSIVFIDEIDAIGQRRGGAVAVANDEREQTLNQLLAEMDGFERTTGVVVLAATNRPEVLDPALLRPGRFDRQVTVPLPNQSERRAILEVHCRGKRLDAAVDLDALARATPGFSGAELANLVNEAAIFAARAGRDVLVLEDFQSARDRIILGRREDSNVLLPSERQAVAVHEAGHALVAVFCDHADPVERVTILPAGQALGVTFQLPLADRHLYQLGYLRDSLAVRLGGRVAEIELLGEPSTGAANDLSSATDLAVKMVREYGLSEALGPVSYPLGGPMFLKGGQEVSSRPFAEGTQERIDAEVERLLREAEERARQMLREHRDLLERLARDLLEHETLDGDHVYRLAGRRPPSLDERRDANARRGRALPRVAASGLEDSTERTERQREERRRGT